MDLLLMATPEGGQPNLLDFLTPFFIVFFIMWLLVIRPQRKEQKNRQLMLDNLKKGDRVITTGGIVGTVMKIKEDKVELKVNESANTKITFLRSAVARVIEAKNKNGKGKD